MKRAKHSQRWLRFPVIASLLLSFCLVHSGCFKKESTSAYYGRIVVPRSQQFRWSDGGLPQTFDPAFAAAPPDTDAVRAIFEGLTDYDPRTLTPVPAVAERWESSDDGRVWTFYLRNDARWSNGDPVTAHDFVRSWRRTAKIGQLSPHTELLNNIVGARANLLNNEPAPKPNEPSSKRNLPKPPPFQTFGAEAVSDYVLRVSLRHSDAEFPALVAHSVFRPVKLENDREVQRLTPNELVSNGAFLLASTGNDRVLLERANQYWGRSQVKLERVEFVGTRDSEAALEAYRAGEVDAVTNAPFEPLALKLLAPYKDFRRATFGALTYYGFNITQEPFDDVRVREALSIAIDRERISRDDLDGATEPARKFLPETMTAPDQPVVDKSQSVETDAERARSLLAEAGFPDGAGFPTIRLLINRNEQQRIVAQAVASMWHSVLNIETEIIMKNWDEYEALVQSGAYDVVRRGMVMQTTDEFTNIRMMFRLDPRALETEAQPQGTEIPKKPGVEKPVPNEVKTVPPLETETQALSQLRAMPIYFASSFSLVRPYVNGFDANVLDAPSLKNVQIDTSWREANQAGK